MKARIEGKNIVKPNKSNENINEKNISTNIKNYLNCLLELMQADGNLKAKNIKRIINGSYKDELFKFSDEKSFLDVLIKYNKFTSDIFNSINEAENLAGYKKIFNDNLDVLDLSKLITSMLAEIQGWQSSVTEVNYDFLRAQLLLYPKKDLICFNIGIKHDEEEAEEEKVKRLKKAFTTRAIVPVYTSISMPQVSKKEKELSNIWNLEDLIKIQKPKDILEFIVNDEAKFKLLYLYFLYGYYTYGEKLIDIDDNWNDFYDIHRNKDGYIVESEALKGLFSDNIISTDKLLLVSGYRALQCLENEDYPIPKNELISMVIEIEKELKDKNVSLNNRFDTRAYIESLNSNIEIIKQKITKKELNRTALKDMYIEGNTSYSVLTEYMSEEDLSESVAVDELIEEYKIFKNDEKGNDDRFYRIAKLYRDNRVKYKTENGDILDDEFDLLKNKLKEINENEGIIEFLKMGIFDTSALIAFNDEKLLMDAFLSGGFSKSDIKMLIDFEILKKSKLKLEVDKLPDSTNKEFLMNNLEDSDNNPKRKFLYSIDPEARSINAGDGNEIFFINGFTIIVDSLSKEVNSGKNTIILDLEAFEDEFGLNGNNTLKLFNKKANGEMSINKTALKKCNEKGVSINFSQNWSDAIFEFVIGDEEVRQSKYDEQDLAEQRRAIKMINEEFQK